MKNTFTKQEIETSIKARIAESLNTHLENIDSHTSFTHFGLSSLKAVGLSLELSELLNIEIAPTIFWDYENIDLLTKYIINARKTSLIKKRLGTNKNLICQTPQIPKKNVMAHNKIPEIKTMELIRNQLTSATGSPLFFINSEELARSTHESNKTFFNLSQYDYIGLAEHPLVKQAAIAAIQRYGNSASASRVAGGELLLHSQLEAAISSFIGTEDCIVFNSGHATNVNTIGSVMTNKDLIVLDELSHNSIILGAKLSGATSIFFKHNNIEDLRNILNAQQEKFARIMIIIEGLYSMDGDFPNLPAIIDVKKEFKTLLYIDEAHSLGTLGKTGRGLMEYYQVNPDDIDFSMGTMGKALGTIGGYIAGKKSLVNYLKYSVPGFVYSIGLNPGSTSAALEAVQLLNKHPEWPQQLQAKCMRFIATLREAGINCGSCTETPIVPIITGNSKIASKICIALRNEGIFTQVIVYPAVPDNAARVRLFITHKYSDDELQYIANRIIAVVRGFL